MYYHYYGLQASPFPVTPSGGSVYMGSSHREAFAALQWGLRDPNGFALIAGEPGTGKTSLILALLATEHGTRIVYFSSPQSFPQILDGIAAELRIDPANFSQPRFARLIAAKLNLFRTRLVLVFDEAQALTDSTLEQLRLFVN